VAQLTQQLQLQKRECKHQKRECERQAAELRSLRTQLEGVRGCNSREVTVDMKLMALHEHVDAVRGKYCGKDAAKRLNKIVDRFGAGGLVAEVIEVIAPMPNKSLLRPLKVNFKGEGAIDEGGCTSEMFSQFFDGVFSRSGLYFERQEGKTAPALPALESGAAGEHVLVGSRRRELDAVRCGFLAAVSGLAKHLDLFHGVELMQVLCGMPHLDAETLLGEISFDDRLSPHTEAYMREFVTDADERTLKNLLSFVTSISVMPRQGLRQKIRATQQSCGGLWQSHTCFYELELPECSSYDEFKRKAITSLDNGSVGFGQQ
jgi:hypothetical protein